MDIFEDLHKERIWCDARQQQPPFIQNLSKNSGSMSHYTTKKDKNHKNRENRDKTTEFLVILTGFGRF
jgi:hypothetical protein